MDKNFIQQLVSILGAEHVVTDADERAYFSQDVYSRADFTSSAVLRPANIDELASVVKLATSNNYAVFPRGGGLSYTGGYLPSTDKSVSIDTSRLNHVVEINPDDMYVTVEAGCTWAALHKALAGTGLRTPFWGTLSGLYATVGGSVSQNSIFFGSGLYGTSADSVTGLKVVAADGRVVETGAGFFRNFGPDMTGLFTGDCGALGIKAEISLKLIRAPKHKAHVSFSFERYQDMLPAMSEIARHGLASECFGFDPFLQAQRMKRESLAKDVKALAGALKASGSVMGALKTGAKLAAAGRGFMKDVPYSVHMTSENHHEQAAQADIEAIEEIMEHAGGTRIENAIPTLVAANPFNPPNSMIGPQGERWAPVHAVVPHSKAVSLMDAITALFAEHKDICEKYNIGTGYLLTSVGASAMVIEPVFFWPDALMDIHHRKVEAGHLRKINGFADNPEARQAVDQIRTKLKNLMAEHKAAHLQIGKTYNYLKSLNPTSAALLKAIKCEMDPDGLINPGSLGLGRGHT
ncbi:MAG: FAD-binding oxidoreductase [Robiginitomaculum sp.]|nr:FAD-binding oxidoreductase [Robiginitomaculum sp.]